MAKETKNDVIPGVNNTQRDVNDGIKKLQNAVKLMKLENEKYSLDSFWEECLLISIIGMNL